MENEMTMTDEGIGDPMPRASEAWHGEWRTRSVAIRPRNDDPSEA